jgi:hypothetical protein
MQRLRSWAKETKRNIFPEKPAPVEVEVANLALELEGFFWLNGTLTGKTSDEKARALLDWWQRAKTILEHEDPDSANHRHLRELIDHRFQNLIEFYFHFRFDRPQDDHLLVGLAAMFHDDQWAVFKIAFNSPELPKHTR